MNEIDTILKEVKDILYDETIVKEFFRVRTLINKNEEINSLEINMKYHEKEMTKHINDDEIYFKEKELYQFYKEKLEYNPLMQNYNQIFNEVYDLLLEVKSILN